MSIVLYREGETHKEKGILCERGLFEVEELFIKLEEGWVNDPVKLYQEPVKRKRNVKPKI